MPGTAKANGKAYRIGSQEELEAAITEYNRLAMKAQAVDNAKKASIATIEARAVEQLKIEVDGKATTIPDRQAEILAAAEKYAKKNPDAARADGKKSRNYTTGVIGFRAGRDSLKLVDKDRFAKVTKSWVDAALKAIAKFFAWKGKHEAKADRLVKIDLKPDMAAIKKERSLKHVTDTQLKKLGLEYTPAEDKIFIESNHKETDKAA